MKLSRLALMAIVTASLLSGGPVSAHGGTVAPLPPPEGAPPQADESFDDAFSGPTYDARHGSCEAGGGGSAVATSTTSSGPEVCPEGFEWRNHSHFADARVRRYNGVQHYHVPGSCTGCMLTYTVTRSVSNAYGYNIGFSVPPLNGATNWNLTKSRSYSVAFAFQVPAGRNMQIQYNDILDVKVHNIRTDYYHCNIFQCYVEERRTGTGWGGKFKHRHVFLNDSGA